MLDHVALEVSDLARAARFYDALMHPLGGRRIVDSPDGIGYGRDRPELWIMPRSANGAHGTNGAPPASMNSESVRKPEPWKESSFPRRPSLISFPLRRKRRSLPPRRPHRPPMRRT